MITFIDSRFKLNGNPIDCIAALDKFNDGEKADKAAKAVFQQWNAEFQAQAERNERYAREFVDQYGTFF
jgi:hypothetical protein